MSRLCRMEINGAPVPIDLLRRYPFNQPSTSAPEPAAGTTMLSSVTQNGTTVTFDKAYPVGQYVNGDYYVVGPATVTGYTPGWDGERNGAMVNPVWKQEQGYSATLAGYTAGLNKALSLPVTLAPGDSFIPSQTWKAGDPGAPTLLNGDGSTRPSLRSAMVLTCEAAAQPAGQFRPPYAGTWRPQANISNVQWNLLPNLPTTSLQPSWVGSDAGLSRVWLDHHQAEAGRSLHPSEHMPPYGRDMAGDAYQALLMLCTAIGESAKRSLLIKVVQYGIDSCGVVKSAYGNAFISGPNSAGAATATPGPGLAFTSFGGGHGVGREAVAAFAAHILGSTALLDIVHWSNHYWGDSGQVRIADGGPYEEYGRAPGEATWVFWGPLRSPDVEGSSYRTCCTTATASAGVLAGRLIPGMREAWGKQALFDYTDWYVMVDQKNPDGTDKQHRGPLWFRQMWDTYRASHAVH